MCEKKSLKIPVIIIMRCAQKFLHFVQLFFKKVRMLGGSTFVSFFSLFNLDFH